MRVLKKMANKFEHLVEEVNSILDHVTEHFINEELENIKRHMKKNNFPLPDLFIVDGNSNVYEVLIKGKLRKIKYEIYIDPLEEDPSGPLITAHYAFIDEKEQFSYTSSAQKTV
jgi:hypothetical protein